MKSLKKFAFMILFVLVCPLFAMACGELKFDDVPYSGTSITGEEIVSDINHARTYMLDDIALRLKIETINTYTFYETEDNSITNKKIKDVIVTTLPSAKKDSDISVAMVETTRYQDGQKQYKQTSTFVRKKASGYEGYVSHCYFLAEIKVGEETISSKSRIKYESGYSEYADLFNSAFVEVKPEEIDKISKKNFEGVNYYKLESVLGGYEAVSERFEQDSNLYLNPQLFKSLSPEFDTPMPFSYVYGLNGAGYLTYAKLNYDLVNSNREKYLSVESVSKVKSYGDKVKKLTEPENADDYTVETFMTDMQMAESYVVYNNDTSENYTTTTTVAKIGSINPNYAVKVETKQGVSVTKTDYYYVAYDESSDSNYQSYKVSKTEKTYQESDYVLDLLKYDFNVGFTKVTNGVYQYGEGLSYINITMKDGEVEKLSNVTNDASFDLYVKSFGTDIESLDLVLSLNGFTLVETEGEGSGD